MTWLKKNLLFTIILVLLSAVLVVEIIYVLGRRAHATEAEEEFNAKVEEYQRLTGKSILPHDRNVTFTQREIDLQLERANQYREALRGREELRAKFDSPPTSRADAFFDIASFVEDYRVKAVAAGVEIPANEHFGFAAYSTSGPDQDRIAEVFRQRVIIAHILDKVIEARPVSLAGIVRAGQARPSGPGRPDGGGSFQLPSEQSLAASNIAETIPFQVVFTGRTHNLRAFMNALAEFEMPLVVRHIDVTTTGAQTSEQQQTGGEPRRGRGRAAEPAAPQPSEEEQEPGREENILIIPETMATFTVSLEYLDVLPIQAASGR